MLWLTLLPVHHMEMESQVKRMEYSIPLTLFICLVVGHLDYSGLTGNLHSVQSIHMLKTFNDLELGKGAL